MRRALDREFLAPLESLDVLWQATRGTRELRDEDNQLARALMRLLKGQWSARDAGKAGEWLKLQQNQQWWLVDHSSACSKNQGDATPSISSNAAGGRAAAPSFGFAFALAGWHWGLTVEQLAYAYCFSWCEAQLGAATRLVPLGQTEAQCILSHLLEVAARQLASSVEVAPSEISSTVPGQVLYSAQHELLYSRLFRS
jgi:urease accessory protein